MTEIRANGLDGAKTSARPVYHKLLSQLSKIQPSGSPIYNFDWDLLVVVDACRFDLMREVQDDYSFCAEMRKFRSLDSTTAYWMRKNFSEEYQSKMNNTGYVCGNPFSDSELRTEWFSTLNEVWRKSWEDPGTVPPRSITDETIRMMRNSSHERTIAHYMQPHCPFLSAPDLSKGKVLDQFGKQDWRDVWELLRDGELSKDEVWEHYRNNLDIVLEDIELLLQSVDAEKVVITSDHGNAMGEMGIYGHPPEMPLDCLRTVPWIETTAVNENTYDPKTELKTDVEISREDQLVALGYK